MDVLKVEDMTREELERVERIAFLGMLEENFQESVRRGDVIKTQAVTRRDRRRFEAQQRRAAK